MTNEELSVFDEIIIILISLIGMFILAILFIIDTIDRKLFWKH